MRSDQVVQVFIHTGFETPLRLHNFTGLSVPVLDCPHFLKVNTKQPKQTDKAEEGMDMLIFFLGVTI